MSHGATAYANHSKYNERVARFRDGTAANLIVNGQRKGGGDKSPVMCRITEDGKVLD